MVSQSQSLQSTTQKYLEIFDISNDLLILQDGACSMVINSSAINFDLYSEEEQDAAIYAYAALLNSLSFPVEIVIRSQKKDVSSYLDLLKTQEARSYTPMNKKNIREYREFVEQLVQERNVLDKKFYIVITYTAIEAGINPGSSFFPQFTKKEAPVLDKHAIIERALTNLEPRRDHLIHQFARIGLSTRQLVTQELIQLFYNIYNPDASKGARLVETQEYATPLVETTLPPQAAVENKTPSSMTPPSTENVISTPTPEPSLQIASTPIEPLPIQTSTLNQSADSVVSTTPPALDIQKIEPQPLPPIEMPQYQPQPIQPTPISPQPTSPSIVESTPVASSLSEEPQLTTDLRPPTPPSFSQPGSVGSSPSPTTPLNVSPTAPTGLEPTTTPQPQGTMTT